jgi:hypothetical protein
MPRTLKMAAIQMDAKPTSLQDRLSRAGAQIAQAAQSGAELVALPEIFNMGYAYDDVNYSLSETLDGPTATWMKARAAEHGIHLVGSLLIRDGLDIYNTALLISPEGRVWRYDKNYPWAWERAYFREGHGITIADTSLGQVGLMVCWDYAHPDLWRQYAGQVDALIITSCPCKADEPTLEFGDGTRIEAKDVTGMPATRVGTDMVFGQDMDAWAKWLGVPVVNTTASGLFRAKVPASAVTLGGMVTALQPRFIGKLLAAPSALIYEAEHQHQTKVINAQGDVVGRVTEPGDHFTVAMVDLADTRPYPIDPEPTIGATGFSHFVSDWFIPTVMIPLYRAGLRKHFGPQYAPVDSRTHIWGVGLLAAMLIGFLWGRRQRQ